MASRIIIGQHDRAAEELAKIAATLADEGVEFEAENTRERGWVITIK